MVADSLEWVAVCAVDVNKKNQCYSYLIRKYDNGNSAGHLRRLQASFPARSVITPAQALGSHALQGKEPINQQPAR
jgi:hypothetical protein